MQERSEWGKRAVTLTKISYGVGWWQCWDRRRRGFCRVWCVWLVSRSCVGLGAEYDWTKYGPIKESINGLNLCGDDPIAVIIEPQLDASNQDKDPILDNCNQS